MNPKLRHITALAVVAAAVPLAACGDDDDAMSGAGTPPAATAPEKTTPVAGGAARGGPGKTVKVAIREFAFAPEALTVKTGTKVEWTNEDQAPHNARGDGGVETRNLMKGDSQAVELAQAGTFEYVCSLHPFMKATVTVR